MRRIWGSLIAGLVVLNIPAIAQTQVEPSNRVQRNVVVRAGPDTATLSIDALDPGETLELANDLPYWYEVRLPDGRKGYVSKAWTIISAIAPNGFRVHVIDVGTGLAIFAEGPGFTLLYDAGSNDDSRTGSRNRVLAYLRKIRPELTGIDHVILSHAHKDHLQLLPDVFDSFAIGNVWDSGRLYDSCGYRRFLQKVAVEPGVAYHTGVGANAPHDFTFENCAQTPKTVTVALGPLLTTSTVALGTNARMTFLYVDTELHEDPNENSLVVLLELGSRRILLMGDAEAGDRQLPSASPQPGSIEAELLACCHTALAADVLVAGHHGSKTSSRSAFLNSVGASTFVISSGPYQYSGTSLPDDEVVDEFVHRGTVWRTDLADTACATNSAKIGTDADGKPGGCNNILIDISPANVLQTSYQQIAD